LPSLRVVLGVQNWFEKPTKDFYWSSMETIAQNCLIFDQTAHGVLRGMVQGLLSIKVILGHPTRSLSSPTRHVPPAKRLSSLTSCRTTDQPEHYDHRTNCYCLYRGWRYSVLDESLQRQRPSARNSLSYQRRSAELFSSFKRILKTELFDSAYSERKQSA